MPLGIFKTRDVTRCFVYRTGKQRKNEIGEGDARVAKALLTEVALPFMVLI